MNHLFMNFVYSRYVLGVGDGAGWIPYSRYVLGMGDGGTLRIGDGRWRGLDREF